MELPSGDDAHSASAVTVLVLTRRSILSDIPRWLSELDGDIVVVAPPAAASDETLAAHRRSFRDVVVVDDYDAPEVEEHIRGLARRHRVSRILSVAEVDILRAARTREALGLEGQDVAGATVYRDKFEMKSRAADGGMAVARMQVVSTAAELHLFAKAVGYPIVVKPVDGGGSVGVAVIAGSKAAADTGAQIESGNMGTLLAEEWIEGTPYYVDGLMRDGQIVHSWPSRRLHPELQTVTHRCPNIGWTLHPGHPMRGSVSAFVADTVGILGSPRQVTAFHAEVFHTPDNRLVLCEIACRPGGVGIVPTYQRAFGVNLYEATLRGQAGLPLPGLGASADPMLLAGYAWIPPQRATLRNVPRQCTQQGVYLHSVSATPGHVYSDPHSVADHVGRILIDGPTIRPLDAQMVELEDWIRSHWSWDPAHP